MDHQAFAQLLGNYGEFLGAIAVFVTLGYLAIQVRQNTIMMKAQLRDAIANKQMAYMETLVANSETFAKVVPPLQPFTDFLKENYDIRENHEAWKVSSLMAMILREWENSHYQYTQGLFAEEEYLARKVLWENWMAIPSFRANWSINREGFAPEFREILDQYVALADSGEIRIVSYHSSDL
jgi:hypothetical protein